MGGNSTNFGSRSEFLPGDGCHEPDIKYERYGGCFVSTKKGVLFIIASLIIAALVGYLVYRYAPRYNEQEFKTAEDLISNLIETASELDNKNNKLKSTLSTNVKPFYYRLRIRPYLDEIGPKNFSFEGHVAIVFQITDTPTKSIIINAKHLTILQSDISLAYSTTSKIEPLKSESQIKEETIVDISKNETEADTTPLPDATVIANNTKTDKTVSENNNETIENTTTSDDITNIIDSSDPSVSPISPTDSINVSPTTESISYNTAEKTNIKVLRKKQDNLNETLTISLEDTLEKEVNYTLEISFSGRLSDGPAGLLRSKYVNGNETRWIASTLFKPYYARMVFPCFDEPHFKTKFEISVGRRTNMTSLSNMPVKDTLPIDNAPGWVWDHFAITPPISTFAVAFAVINFNPKKALSTAPLPVINIWARNEVLNKSSYLLDVTPKILKAYNNFYGYNYPSAKMDLVVMQEYPVASVANWGLIFLRENVVRAENNDAKEELNEILSQELSSQWLGNIITMKTWNEFWFTEILNSYARYIGIDAAEPTWNIKDQVAFWDEQDILDADSMDILPNMTTLISHYDYLENNRLLYKKGSSIIRILNYTLTEPVFLEVMHRFVHKWQYNNTEENDFWEEVTLSSNSTIPNGVSVKDMINLWITQKGYPLLNTTRDYANGAITITQNRFLETNHPDNNLWIIPLQLITDNMGINESIWLQNSSMKINEFSSELKNDSWILITVPQMAPCRINYDLNNWKLLIVLLQTAPETFSAPVRANLLDDAFHLARAGIINYSIPLNLSLYLVNETHLIPWTAAFKNLEYLDSILSKTSTYGEFQEYILNLLRPIYKYIESSNDDQYSSIKLRKLVKSWACKFSYAPCVDWAYSKYLVLTNSTDSDEKNRIEPDYHSIVYCVGAQMRGKLAWDYLWNKYIYSYNKSNDTKAVLTGIGCLKENWILTDYLQEILKENATENSVIAWESLSSGYAIDVAFDFLLDNWNAVVERYYNSDYVIKRILNAVLSKLTLKSDLDKLMKFYGTEKLKLQYFARDFAFIIERIKMKVDWQEKYLMTFNKWIKFNKF